MKKMNAVLSAALLFGSFLCISESHGFLKGDINGDEKIGLTESINALQVASGTISATAVKTVNVPGDFATIQEAVNAVSEGDTISVAAGTYNENISITKDQITIQGAGRETATIKGDGTFHTITVENARGVTISGFLITGGICGIRANFSSLFCKDISFENNSKGLRASRNSYLVAVNCLMTKSDGEGLRIDQNSFGDIINCEISGNSGMGIRVKYGALAFIENNTKIMNNKSDGIVVKQMSVVEILGACQIVSNEGNGISVGNNSMISFSEGSSTISNNNGDGINCYADSRIDEWNFENVVFDSNGASSYSSGCFE